MNFFNSAASLDSMTNSVTKSKPAHNSVKNKHASVGQSNVNAATAKTLFNIDEAAAYTRRSRRTFQRECRRGLWTCIKVGGGHPRFSKEDLDKDMEAWTIVGKHRKSA